MKLFNSKTIERALFEDGNIAVFERKYEHFFRGDIFVSSDKPFYLSNGERVKGFKPGKKRKIPRKLLGTSNSYLWSYCFENGDGMGYDLDYIRRTSDTMFPIRKVLGESRLKSKLYLPVTLRDEGDENYEILYKNDGLSIQRNSATEDVYVFSKNKFSVSTEDKKNKSRQVIVTKEGGIKKDWQIGPVPQYEYSCLSDPSVLLKIGKDRGVEEITPPEYYEATGRNPREFKMGRGIGEYIKESLKTSPVARTMLYSSVIGAAGLGFLYKSTNFLEYLGFLEGINLINYIASPYLMKKIFRVKWVDDLKGIKAAAKKIDVKLRKVGISEWDKSNAFAYSYPFVGGNVVLTKRILERLTDEEVMAVAGHEFGHIKRNDTTKLYLLSSLLLPLSGAMTWTVWKSFGWEQYLSLVLGLTAVENGISYLQKKFEYNADKFAAKHFGESAFISALSKIIPKRLRNTSSSSHPSLYERTIALESEHEGKDDQPVGINDLLR